MKIKSKFICGVVLVFFIVLNSFAGIINHIDSFETTSGIIFGVDKFWKIERTNEDSSDGEFSVKLSFNTNYPNVVRNFFLPVVAVDKRENESLLFDAYNKSGSDIILFYKVFFASNKNVEVSTKLIKHKKTTVEIPFALIRTNAVEISGYQFFVTNNIRNGSLYFDNFRTEQSSYSPFKKIAYLDLAEKFLSTGIFFFSRGVLGQVFKNTVPLTFEKIEKINLFAAKGESIYYTLSFRTARKEEKISVELSNFISKETNEFQLTKSIGKIEFIDKKLSFDSKFYVADMPIFAEPGNSFSNLPAETSRTFIFMLKIPESADSDEYKANIIVESITACVTNKSIIPVFLKVFPFKIKSELPVKNVVFNCDPGNIKPEVNRFVSGFFKEAGGGNGIVKISPNKIEGDALDDFDCNEGDRTALFSSNKISIAYYAACLGKNDLKYLILLQELINKSVSQNLFSNESKKAEENIKYLLDSLKTTPPLDIASKWTAMLTKEQVTLIGKNYDSNAVAFVTGEQKLPNGWTLKDYNRVRLMLANDIIKLLGKCEENLNSNSLPAKLSYAGTVSIPLSRGEKRRKKRETVYSVRKLLSAPEMKGIIDGKEWANALKIKRFARISGEDNADAHTEARIGWYGSNFYVQVICYDDENNDDVVGLYIRPGNENKIWNKFSVSFSGMKKKIKSDGKLCTQSINIQLTKTGDCRCVEFEIPLTNCLTHSSDFGLNICCERNNNVFAWKTFNKNKLKFMHIKLDGAEKIVDALIDPIKEQPLKIISSDAFAFGKKDVIAVEIEWEGERRLLKKSKIKFKMIGKNGKEYQITTLKSPVLRQKVYLELNNFVPGVYNLYIILLDSNNEEISSANVKIKVM